MFSIFSRCRCEPIVDTMQYIKFEDSDWIGLFIFCIIWAIMMIIALKEL